ncbi:histidine-specific methyltransferase [Podospora australis]|uniref:Histidine-specific methyltransferase n=1 Tax=Podospora australis TaxID=1536484 RepID=A0AAN6WLD7_9PEZI|nr:histidine-specific methyltransferase [Podospora australis]
MAVSHFQHQLPPLPQDEILDIRSSNVSLLHNLDSKVLEGLTQPHGDKILPTLLLWDEKGQLMYGDILATQHYYPYQAEEELFQQQVDDIAHTVASSGPDMVIELGAGDMTKTARLLSALDNALTYPLVYYALDVDQALLERSFAMLKKRITLRHITLRGLLGTYEDSARWLSSPDVAAYRKTMVFLGSSICNDDQDEAIKFLSSYTRSPETGVAQNVAGFLLAVDGCQDAAQIEAAYDVPGGASRRWVKHALEAARDLLGGGADDAADVNHIFDDDNWRFEGGWQPERQRYQNYLVPVRSLTGTIRGQRVSLAEGERVASISSGKWAQETVNKICSKSGLKIQTSWKNSDVDYRIYWLQPALRRHDSGIDIPEFDDE